MKNYILRLLAILLLLSSTVFARKVALLVGVDDYKGKKYDFNGGSKVDLKKMGELFSNWGFRLKHLYNQKSLNLRKELIDCMALNEDDEFIFYFSGHGSTTKDLNGDEKDENGDDKQDEVLVLSNGKWDERFLDDELNELLNNIKARKLIILDACHSGTAFKKFDNSMMSKSIPPQEFKEQMPSSPVSKNASHLAKGSYVVLSASKDSEKSLSTPKGSLFTNALFEKLKREGSVFSTLSNIKDEAKNEIALKCKGTDFQPHHPKISVSDSRLKYESIAKFLRVVNKVNNKLTLKGKSIAREGEAFEISVNTHENLGYITLISLDNGSPFIVSSSDEPKKGKLLFSQVVEKSCKNCKEEKTLLYVILSAKEIDEDVLKKRKLNLNGRDGSRAFQGLTHEEFEPMMDFMEFVVR